MGATGYSYERLFARCFVDAGRITSVQIDETYLKQGHQLDNFDYFCRLVIRRCRTRIRCGVPLRRMHLRTRAYPYSDADRIRRLLAQYELDHHISFTVSFHGHDELHARKVLFHSESGTRSVEWDRGLDIYQCNDRENFGQRPCRATDIHYFYKPNRR